MDQNITYKTILKEEYKRGTIITFHGGCFMGGNTSYDRFQNVLLSSLGYDVHQVCFPKNYTEFIRWTNNFNFEGMQQPIYTLGRSSGGYLAKIFATINVLEVKKAIYICPVFNPHLRYQINPQFKEKTLEFFDRIKNSGMSTKMFDKDRELLLLAKRDENVPNECFTKKQLQSAIYLGPTTHKGMLSTTSKAFAKLVMNHFQ